ncbi:10162_t:CDS:2, partial [Funneliformis geosporum]
NSIIKQAYVIMNYDPVFKNAYCKMRRYPYNARTLEFLSDKASLFLLQYFQNIFYNCGQRKEVDLRCLPIAYSTAYPLQLRLCDSCKLSFIENKGTVFICGTAYHMICYREESDKSFEKVLEILSRLTTEINKINF